MQRGLIEANLNAKLETFATTSLCLDAFNQNERFYFILLYFILFFLFFFAFFLLVQATLYTNDYFRTLVLPCLVAPRYYFKQFVFASFNHNSKRWQYKDAADALCLEVHFKVMISAEKFLCPMVRIANSDRHEKLCKII